MKIWVSPLEKDVSRLLAIGPRGQIEVMHSKDYRIPRITRGEYKQYRRKIKDRNQPYSLTHGQIAQQVKIEHQIVAQAKKSRRTKRLQEVRNHYDVDEFYPTSNQDTDSEPSIKDYENFVHYRPRKQDGENFIEYRPALVSKLDKSHD